MKWYFAGRVRHQPALVEVARFLESKGEKVNSGWIYEGSLKPYEKNLGKVQALARRVVDSLMQANVFVLISDPEGTDMFVELGICLAQKKLREDINIYIVGEHSKRSLMQLHPDIIHLDNLAAVFDAEKIDHQDFNTPIF